MNGPYKSALEAMESIEERLISRNCDINYSPLLIIGLPRSGTTLLYKLIAYSFDVCYINNLMDKLRFPCLLSYALRNMGGCTATNNFKSRYGKIPGWREPAAGGRFWDSFFSTPEVIDVDERDFFKDSGTNLRNSILHMQDIFQRPFINKSLRIPARIGSINNALPESLFIRIKRKHIDVAQSILKGRKEYFDDVNHWFSAKPSRYEDIKEDNYIQQICGQIYYLEEDMDKDVEKIGIHRCLNLHYEDLCENPDKICKDIESFYNKNTVKHKIMRRRKAPASFEFSTGRKCAADDYQKLKDCLSDYFSGGTASNKIA